jgi:[methyl-Co(III) methanol-specific corrinoid protein]:coenzyme M methyltransferase
MSMNSRERFLAAFHGRAVDRPPLVHVAALTTVELQEQTGCFMPEVHQDPAAQARLGFANHEVLGFDAVSFLINYFNEPAALGCAVNWGTARQLPMFGSHPWVEPKDAKVPGDLLDRAPVRNCLETLRIAKKNYGDRVGVIGKVMGPFSMAQVMHGVENVMMGLIDEPEMVEHFVRQAAEILVSCANAQFEVGIDALAIGEGGAGANMLSPAMYEKFLLKVHLDMIGRIRGPVILHMCGDISPRLDMLGRIGLAGFNFDWNLSPGSIKAVCGDKFKLIGNISTTDLLNGAPETIEKQVFENLAAGIDMIGPGCAVSPLCPNANLRAMVEAIEKWSKR